MDFTGRSSLRFMAKLPPPLAVPSTDASSVPVQWLGDARRLARAVDAGDHDHGRPAGGVADALVGRRQQRLELVLDEDLDVAGDLLVEERLADALDDLAGGGGADVGEVEALLE